MDQDLSALFHQQESIWQSLKDCRMFITGGTGFIGCWLLESLRYADQMLNLQIHVTVLTRNPTRFAQKAPHLFHYPGFHFLTGDVRTFASPPGEFTHLIHAATDANAALNAATPKQLFETMVLGTQRVLDFAVEKSISRMLFLSSGAVYGRQPWEVEQVGEEWTGAPNCTDPLTAYAEGKRAAEMLCAIYASQHGLHVAIARIFSLIGPYLPLDIHYAAGNFIRDALQGRPIIVTGNGQACRSYLYAADLAAWLWQMLFRAESCRPYNVGSDVAVSIRDLAECVARVIGTGEYQILGQQDVGWNPGRYIPDITRIRRDLGVMVTIPLDEAIRRTAAWHGWQCS